MCEIKIEPNFTETIKLENLDITKICFIGDTILFWYDIDEDDEFHNVIEIFIDKFGKSELNAILLNLHDTRLFVNYYEEDEKSFNKPEILVLSRGFIHRNKHRAKIFVEKLINARYKSVLECYGIYEKYLNTILRIIDKLSNKNCDLFDFVIIIG